MMKPPTNHPQADLFPPASEELTPAPDVERQRLLEGIYQAQELATGRKLTPDEKQWIAGKVVIN